MTAAAIGSARSGWTWASVSMLVIACLQVVGAGYTDGADHVEYRAAADALLGDGSYSQVRYPPGFPAVVAPLRAFGWSEWLAPLLAALALVCLIWWAAVRLGGHLAGVAAGVVCALSPMIFASGRWLMSDAQAAALVAAALVAGTYGRWVLAGVLTGLSAWTRIAHAAFVAASPRWRMAAAAAATIVPLVVFNLVVWGSFTGYQSDHAAWSFRHLWESGVISLGNPTGWSGPAFYGMTLFGIPAVGLQLVALLPVPAVIEMWRRRSEAMTRLAARIALLNVLTYVPYLWQAPRFVLPAATIIVIYASAWTSRTIQSFAERHRVSRGGEPHSAYLSAR